MFNEGIIVTFRSPDGVRTINLVITCAYPRTKPATCRCAKGNLPSEQRLYLRRAPDMFIPGTLQLNTNILTLELSVNIVYSQPLQTTPHTVQQYIGCILIIDFLSRLPSIFFLAV